MSEARLITRRHFTAEEEERIINEARAITGDGVPNIYRLSRDLDVGEDWLRRRLVYGYSSQRNQRYRARLGLPPRVKRVPQEDTRDFTGRHFGDPLPGRSALDQRGHDA